MHNSATIANHITVIAKYQDRDLGHFKFEVIRRGVHVELRGAKGAHMPAAKRWWRLRPANTGICIKGTGMLFLFKRRGCRSLFFARSICSAFFWFALVAAQHAQAASTSKVYFAGVAFTHAAANVKENFPHASAALSADANRRLNQSIQQQLQHQAGGLDIIFDGLGSIKDASQSTALALGIDREATTVEHIGNVYKLRIEIAAEALFFDFKEKQVLGGFPFTIDFIDTSPAPPTADEIQTAYDGMVLGAQGRHSLATEFAKTLSTIQVPNAANKHLRVTSVTIGTKAIDYIKQPSPHESLVDLPVEIAEAFGQALAANQRISILPYSSNQALGSSMAARFIEGEAFQLKIPEADYEIHLDIVGFKKIDQSHSAVETMFLYGSFVDVSVTEPLSAKTYFSQRIKQGVTKSVPLSQTTVDDWEPAHESLLILFDNFSRALSLGHSSWVKSGMPDTPEAKSQLTSLSELIQSCR